MELYHETFLRRAGAMIGIVLKIDKLTLIHSRGKFARICVEFGQYGHKAAQCVDAPTVKEPEVQAAKEGESVRADVISNNGVINVEVPNMVTGEVNMVMTSNPNDFEPWMIASKLFRRKAKSSSQEVIGGKNKLN
ncbi:hypothetical protein JHK82_048175 [Glycine max]|nr:hypothetical protein JHK86_048049 [Glycine max]KAG5098321.1 hypothetical protein JHK82_048175 [Glycine max]